MEVSGGWQFWLEDHGRVRQFMVAEADEIKARKVLREKLQNEKILSDAEYEARRTLRMGCN